jgi:hypothetical protein
MIKKLLQKRAYEKRHSFVSRKFGHTLYCSCQPKRLVILNDPHLECSVVRLRFKEPVEYVGKGVKYRGELQASITTSHGSRYSNYHANPYVLRENKCGALEVDFQLQDFVAHNVSSPEEELKSIADVCEDFSIYCYRCPICSSRREPKWTGFVYDIAPTPIAFEMLGGQLRGFNTQPGLCQSLITYVCESMLLSLPDVTVNKAVYDTYKEIV